VQYCSVIVIDDFVRWWAVCDIVCLLKTSPVLKILNELNILKKNIGFRLQPVMRALSL